MQIEDDVEPFRPQTPREPQIVANTRQPARPRHDDDLGEVGVAGYDRRGVAFHEVSQAGFRERPLEGPEKRRREDHVTDETQADEQYLHVSAARRARLGCPLRLDRRLVEQHDRDIVLDRIDALALAALERGCRS